MSQTTKRSCVIVLGMYRSGTSTLTKKIIDMGFATPSEVIPAHNIDNSKDYWEPKELVRINNRLLESLGFKWDSIDPLPEDSFTGELAREAASGIKALLTSAFLMKSQLVIKDPRLCRLLPVLLTALEELEAKVAIVFIVRNPDAVFQSLSKRQEIATAAVSSREQVDLMWLRHNLEAEMHSRSTPRFCLSFEAWIENSEYISRELLKFFDTSLPDAKVESTIDELIAPLHKKKSLIIVNDIQRLNEQLYHIIAGTSFGSESIAWLDSVKTLAAVTIPEKSQLIASPPATIKTLGYLKHISASVAQRIPDTQSPPLIFISQSPKTRSHIYRVKNPVDALNKKGVSAFWTTPEKLQGRADLLRKARKIIIHRSEWSHELDYIVEVCKFNKVPISYDLDDLIIDPEIIKCGYLPFINCQGTAALEQWLNKAQSYYRALCLCDEVICSTMSLASYLDSMGHCCRFIPNGFSDENLLLSEYWANQRPLPSDGLKRVGYASGTATHDADFATIIEPLAKWLQSNPNWIFTVIGQLSIGPLRARIPEHQIEIRTLVQPINLAFELARLDINLIPLEANSFCDAKSPLKWYEAALCGTPSIATKNPTYEWYLESQTENCGLLASSTNDWFRHLNELASSEENRKQIANSARLYCENNLHSSGLCAGYL